MSLRESSRLGPALYCGSLGAVALLAGGRLAGRETSPWALVAAFAAGTALVAGQLAWLARDRLLEARRRVVDASRPTKGRLSSPTARYGRV